MEHVCQHAQHTVHLIIYHIIWCPRRIRKVFVGPMHDRLKQMIEHVIEENGWQRIELAIQPDRVHLSLLSNPYTLLTAIARLLKGRSSHELREEFPIGRKCQRCGRIRHALVRQAMSIARSLEVDRKAV